MLTEILRRFGIVGDVKLTDETSGHINETYVLDSADGRYILQSVNKAVFRDPQLIMRNVERIEKAFADSLEYWVRIPEFLRCDGKNCLELGDKLWRIYPFTEKAVCADDRRHGFAVGRFINIVNSRGIVLEDPMPKLHNFNIAGLPKRNIHGDTKSDNVILGKIFTTVIDLDTAKQGYVCADYGDMIRSITRYAETPDELELWRIDEATRGFAEGLDDLDGMLTQAEVDSLFGGILLIIDELSQRYLDDIEGRTRDFPNRTIEQCRKRYGELKAQRALFEKNEKAVREIIGKYF